MIWVKLVSMFCSVSATSLISPFFLTAFFFFLSVFKASKFSIIVRKHDKIKIRLSLTLLPLWISSQFLPLSNFLNQCLFLLLSFFINSHLSTLCRLTLVSIVKVVFFFFFLHLFFCLFGFCFHFFCLFVCFLAVPLEVPGQWLNLSHSRDNAGSLIHWATRTLLLNMLYLSPVSDIGLHSFSFFLFFF